PQVRAGLILMMDRTFDERQNAIVVEKAIRYASRGIVGIDIAGPRPDGGRYPYRDLVPLVEEARNAGLGVTIHVGEEGEEHGVAFTIATDGPEMMRTHLLDEFKLLERIGALDKPELAEANARGHEASFVHAEAARSASPSRT